MGTLTPPELPDHLPRNRVDEDAYAVCQRLTEAGFTTYLVGGCVRDILLERHPKDFDVGTLATPQEVRKLFRNCRIIGRRFKLAHVVFGAKIIEVATFRGTVDLDSEDDGDPLIRSANNFGTPEEDAIRRDFTINALFYDPVHRQIFDHVGGYKDLLSRTLRTIGPAEVRFREDPVRILRAVKFASRLGFDLADETRQAMTDVATDIQKCSVPRVTEEIYRLAESGHARGAFELMYELNILPILLPEISEHIDADRDDYLRFLGYLDDLRAAHGALPRDFVLAALYYPLALRVLAAQFVEAGPGWGRVVEDWFHPIGVRMHIAVKHRHRLRALVNLVGRFMSPTKRLRRHRLGHHDQRALPQALSLLRLHHRTYGGVAEAYEEWREFAERHRITWTPVSAPHGMSDTEENHGNRRFRSRRRGGRQRRR
ncbi:MAG: polynucleotide adenylyltransferase PcnB [Myxococcota bacterium]|nr:polynucleotide adenylyltransferase PcnB [Myxococcota bacterium]